MPENLDPRRLSQSEIADRYLENISELNSKELVNELEKRALMASYGYQDPTTAMMLKVAKAEILRRIKEGDSPRQEAEPKQETAPRASLFG